MKDPKDMGYVDYLELFLVELKKTTAAQEAILKAISDLRRSERGALLVRIDQ